MNNELLARLRDLAHYDRATIEAAINALSAPSATAAPSVWTCVYNGLVEKPCKVCDCEMKGGTTRMSNTPRTDAATIRMERLDGDIDEVVSADFAKRLEGHLAAAETQLQEAWRQVASATDAPRSATGAPDRPDWAQQLPGAELYDRDHGYDRTASLNEGRYVCTCGACSHYDAGGRQK